MSSMRRLALACLWGTNLLIAALVWLPTAHAGPPEGYPFLHYDAGVRRAKVEHKMIFLYLGRYGSRYCEKVNRETFSDPRLHRLYTRHYVLVYVDAESARRLTLPSGEQITEAELGARLHAAGTPLFAYLKPDGTPVIEAAGYRTVRDFIQLDRYIHNGHYLHEPFSRYLDTRP